MDIYPAILTDSIITCTEQLVVAQADSRVEVVHIDVIDGLFADNVTLTPSDLVITEPGDLKYDLHLMTNDPLDYVFETELVQDELPVRSIIAQVEHMAGQAAFLEQVRKRGWLAGLALDFHTPLEAIDEVSWLDLDIIHLMSIELGFQGRPFKPEILAKIAEVQEKISDLDKPPQIIVDGGISLANLKQLAAAKVSGVAIGSAIWQASDPTQMLQSLLDQVEV